MYSGSYSSHRFSPLAQITTDNVAKLRPVWVYQPPGIGSVESTPVVANGVMYATSGPTMVAALDLKSGKPLWEWTRPIAPSVLNLGFPRVNRGVAVLDNMVYVGTLDGYLVALDAQAGIERWSVHVGENPTGHSITAAPLAVDDKVIVGVSGGEAGIRGFLDAYDAKTGKRLWRFYTDPSAGRTRQRDAGPATAGTGGGATWLTGSYDPELKLLYWGTGNPGPDWNGDYRNGDNLYTSSLVALDVDTGKLRWHFQFTPHDTHDWDANQIPVLVDTQIGGRPRKLVVTANRNGFFYVLDRKTGEFVFGTPFAKQTWAKGLDEEGRPIAIPGMEPIERRHAGLSQSSGIDELGEPVVQPERRTCSTCRSREMGSIYYKSEHRLQAGHLLRRRQRKAARRRIMGRHPRARREDRQAAWEFKLPSPTWAGVLSTAGGLVFSGIEEGNFYALDAKSGKPLWQFPTGGASAGRCRSSRTASSTSPSPAVTRCSSSRSTVRKPARPVVRPARPAGRPPPGS